MVESGYDELRRAIPEATPGPWRGCAHVSGTDATCPCRYRGDISSAATDEMVAQMGAGPVRPEEVEIWDSIQAPSIEQGYANGRLIVLAVNSVAALLAERDALLDFVRRFPSPDGSTGWNEERYELLARIREES